MLLLIKLWRPIISSAEPSLVDFAGPDCKLKTGVTSVSRAVWMDVTLALCHTLGSVGCLCAPVDFQNRSSKTKRTVYVVYNVTGYAWHLGPKLTQSIRSEHTRSFLAILCLPRFEIGRN